METFNVFLTTSEGESAPARIVIDLDSLTVVIRDDPVAGWNLRDVVATRTGPETLAVKVADESFTIATTRAEQLSRLLPVDPPMPPTRRKGRSGRHRGAGWAAALWSTFLADVRRPPPSPAVWWLALAMAVLIAVTVWSILSA